MISESVLVEGKDLPSKLIPRVSVRLRLRETRTFGNVVVALGERYYLRIDSNLLEVVVFHFRMPGECLVTAFSGGGKEGAIGIGWGAEKHSVGSILDMLTVICRKHGWRVRNIQER